MGNPREKKRILFLSERFPYPLHDGGNLRTFHLLRGLASAYEVTLVAHAPDHDVDTALAKIREFCPVLAVPKIAWPYRLPINVVRRGWQTGSLFALKNWSDSLLRCAGELLRQHAFDAVHFNQLDTVCYLLTGTWPRIKVFDTHNCLTAMAEQVCREKTNWGRRLLYHYETSRLRNLELFATRQANVSFVCSEQDAEVFRQVNPSGNYRVIPNGVDTTNFQAAAVGIQQSEEPNCLLFTGAMNYYPNEQAAIYFCREILPLLRDLPLKVYFVGQSPPPTVQNLHDGQTVFVTGRVPDVRPYMNRCQVFIVPLRHGSGTRLKICEAFAMGKAVVSTSLGAEGIPATPGNEIRLANDPATFAAEIRSLLNNPADRQSLGTAARKLVCERLDWNRINATVIEEYEQLFQRNAAN